MNRGFLQSSPVQQIMASGNPNWFPIATTRPPSHHLSNSPFSPPLPTHHNNLNFLPPQTHHTSFPFSSPSWTLNDLNDSISHQDQQVTQDSWSQQIFMNGLVGEELVKQESNTNSCAFVYPNNEDFQQIGKPNNNSCWSPHNNKFLATNSSTTCVTATSSPQSCITNLFEFSSSPATATATAKSDQQLSVPVMTDPISECNSSGVQGGTVKKAKIQTSTQSTFKVRKFGDRITSLHQLVSPFGKTDTASVLLEAIGYIRFLHSQIEALSIPYLSNGSGNNKRQQRPHSVQGERNCIFPEDGGQLLNDKSLKRKGGPDQEEPKKDLRSIGLCLVPVSCITHVGRENGADYWAPALGGFK